MELVNVPIIGEGETPEVTPEFERDTFAATELIKREVAAGVMRFERGYVCIEVGAVEQIVRLMDAVAEFIAPMLDEREGSNGQNDQG